jgi:hypothetical protein
MPQAPLTIRPNGLYRGACRSRPGRRRFGDDDGQVVQTQLAGMAATVARVTSDRQAALTCWGLSPVEVRIRALVVPASHAANSYGS